MPNPVEAFISGLSEKEKKMLYITVGIVAVMLFDRLILGPMQKESKNIEERIKTDTMQIRKSSLVLQYRDKVKKESDDYSIFYTEKGLSSEKLIGSFLSEVEEFAKGAKIILTNINPVSVEEKTGYSQYSLTIECSGSMSNIVAFIYAVDNSKKPIRVISYSISPKDRDNYEVKCILTIIKAIIYEDAKLTPEKKDQANDREKPVAEEKK